MRRIWFAFFALLAVLAVVGCRKPVDPVAQCRDECDKLLTRFTNVKTRKQFVKRAEAFDDLFTEFGKETVLAELKRRALAGDREGHAARLIYSRYRPVADLGPPSGVRADDRGEKPPADFNSALRMIDTMQVGNIEDELGD